MFLGIDIGGTYLRYEFREKEKTLKKESLSSKKIGLCSFLENILQEEKAITAVFISYAGQVNKGTILDAPHITIDRHDITTYIQKKYGVKLFIENDLNCAVLAEAKLHKSTDISAVSIGTGLGLGVISSGELMKGHNGMATELGHIPYKESPFTCECTKKNCIELFCSGDGLVRWQAFYKITPQLNLQELQESTQKQAQKVYKEFIEALYYAVGTTITLFNPEIVILGGGIITHNPSLKEQIAQNIKDYALPLALQDTRIAISTLKNASLEGAFLLGDYNG